MYVGTVFMLIGVGLIILGWKAIHRDYWSKAAGEGQLVTHGIYAYIRHPQYTGFLLITLGMLLDWATLPLLIMWPMLVILYYHLARREEADMAQEFGAPYEAYRRRTSMFLPWPKFHRAVPGATGV
jgi:protein-S-isoprenylcysteine O-methyltransferase Ste14